MKKEVDGQDFGVDDMRVFQVLVCIFSPDQCLLGIPSKGFKKVVVSKLKKKLRKFVSLLAILKK